MQVVQKRKIWITISTALIAIGILFMIINAVRGVGALNFDVEFMGGSEFQVEVGEDFVNKDIADIVSKVTGQPSSQVQRIIGKNQVNIKIKTVEQSRQSQLQGEFKVKYPDKEDIGLVDVFEDAFKAKYPNAEILSFSDVSATISGEMQMTALTAVLIACLAMLIYITIRFKDIKSGTSAIIALVHDVLIVLAAYAVFRIPINNSFIAALLTIIGYSINNTIVIFDRIRENKNGSKNVPLDTITNDSVKQTMTRSIFTSLTTMFTITCLYIFGVASIREFALPMIIGIVAGTYSSIAISTSVWYMLNQTKRV